MIADGVVAWEKHALKNKDLFSPKEVTDEINKVKNVSVDCIDYKDKSRASYTGWGEFLGKYLKKMSAGFTNNYVLEFTKEM